MDRWTLVLEALPGSLVAVRVDEEDHRPIDVELVDGDAEELGRSFAAPARVEGSHPEHLVVVVPGDLDAERFATLTEAADLAGLPEPSWLPDAVAWAGTQLVEWVAGTRALVVDARGDDLVAWSVRTADDGVAIAQGGPLALGERLDTLLAGVVRAKLAVEEPELADALRRRADAAARRDAAHLDRELRQARRLLSRSAGEELVISAGESEIFLTHHEFTRLADHALRDVVVDALGHEVPHLPMIVVADRPTAIVDQLAARATVVWAPEHESSVAGAAALVLPRASDALEDPTPTDRFPRIVLPFPVPPAPPHGGEVVPAPRAPARHRRRLRWAVPAALAGSALRR